MKKKTNPKQTKTTQPPAEGRQGNAQAGLESYLAPAPSSKGRSIGIDCHPDTFTWAVLTGTTLHEARQLETHADRPLQALLDWAATHGTPDDTFLMEAGSNSFEICRRLHALGLRAYVLESAHAGRHAALHCDNDKIAAVRIAKVYLIGKAPCVWQPDPVTAGRRELLHAHQSAVSGHTAATNALKGYLNLFTVRPGKQGMDPPPSPPGWAARANGPRCNRPCWTTTTCRSKPKKRGATPCAASSPGKSVRNPSCCGS